MTIEVELKYLADGPEPLDRLRSASSLGPARLGPAREVAETDRYLDTTDGRLAASRWAARLRRREGATRLSMKGPAVPATAPGLHRRPELEGPASDALDPSAWPPSEATALLDRICAGALLVERFRLVQTRTERAVLVDGETLGTLSLDLVRIEAMGSALGSLRVVELELAAGAPERHESLLGELDAGLRGFEGLCPDDRSKLEYALDLLAGR